MERQKVRSLMTLVRVACIESFTMEFSFLRPLLKNIEMGSELNADIVIVADNYTKAEHEYRMGPAKECPTHRAEYLEFMARGLFTFNSQVKRIEFRFRDMSATGTIVRIRFSQLRSRNVQCDVFIKSETRKHPKFECLASFRVSQRPEDGPVTVRDNWFIRLLKWMANKVVPTNEGIRHDH